MSKHHHDDCCCYTRGYAYAGGAGAGCGPTYGIKWIYALLILIVIVLQFGKKDKCCDNRALATTECDNVVVSKCDDNSSIDNSVLFIIVVFLLIICAGCVGGLGGYSTSGGYGY